MDARTNAVRKFFIEKEKEGGRRRKYIFKEKKDCGVL